MKTKLNLHSEQHSKLISDIIEKALYGITPNEIIKLKNICEKDRYVYYSHVKLKYTTMLGLLGLKYQITEEIEETIFFFIHDIIQRITISMYSDMDSPLKINLA